MQVRAGVSRPKLATLGAFFFAFMVVVLYHKILTRTGGHFLYLLDDPYIHLALAENLARGHYGINATEYSSPSSSLLWPFLLIVGAGSRFHAFVPLMWNTLFGVITAALLGWVVATWPPQVDENGRMRWWKQAVTVLLLIFVANLPILTFMGLEHVLQVLLAVCCAIGMIKAFAGEPIPAWCLAAAILAPSVRYEDLALTLAIALALVGAHQWRRALAVLCLSLVPLAAFSAFLKSCGLPLLPMSVLVKGSAYAHASLLVKLVTQIETAVHMALTDPERYPLAVFLLLFSGLAWGEKLASRRFVFLGAAAVAALQLLLGPPRWYFRYEVYALIFLTLLCLRVLAERPRFLFGYYSLGLLFCASAFLAETPVIAIGAQEIYNQQYQMHRFVTGFYQGDYAVNDLGWASFDRRPGTYVLDLLGLASEQAATHPDKDAPWLENIVSRHRIPLTMIYAQWFHIPHSWTPVAELCASGPTTVAAHQCVLFYSTSADPVEQATIRQDLERFSATIPPDDFLEIAHSPADVQMWAPTMH
jgi:hypothetical protein